MKLDLDELERQIRAAMDDGDPDAGLTSHRQTLALIARIRELEEVVREFAGAEGTDTMAFLESGMNARDILDKGAVLP